MKFFGLVLLFFSVPHSKVSAQFGGGDKYGPCTTPNGLPGTCVPWNSCKEYQHYIQTGTDDPVKTAFLRERICKEEFPDIYLCCPSEFQFPTEVECGITTKSTINEPGSWPWLAALGVIHPTKGFVPNCAGTLITNRHVLSVATCFLSSFKATIVRLGEYSVKDDSRGESPQDYRIIMYSTDYYKDESKENDIIVLPLDRDVIFNDNIRPACLPFPYRNHEIVGHDLTVVGWGKPSFAAAEHSPVPVAGPVPVVDRTNCSLAYSRLNSNIVLDERNLCAGDGSVDACQGDAGAPLNYYNSNNNRYYVVGIVSYGVGCANAEFPGVYTRVASFLSWLSKVIH